MVPASQPIETGRRLLSALAVLFAAAAAVYLLLPNPLADAFFAAWVTGSVFLALVGGIAAWTNRTPLAWVTALLMTILSIVTMTSLGLFVAPSAAFLLGAALLSRRAEPRRNARKAIAANPPPVREFVLKVGAGVGAIAVGTVLVYATAIVRGLFEACSNETLSCAVENTHWLAVGGTVLGLLAISVGCWLIWKQIYVARVLASRHVG